jgi:RNA polymerase sigma-70 factor (ECF subfamily)
VDEFDASAGTDAELLARAKGGEVESFGQIYVRYLRPIYLYLRSRVADEKDAEDLTEMVFLRAFQSLPRYQERGLPFSAFLYQVARRLLIDHFRKVRREVPLDEAKAEPGTPDHPDTRMEKDLDVSAVVDAMGRLPDSYQEVIRLRVLLGMPTKEAAAWLGRSEGATRILLHRALYSLRRAVRGRRG